MYEYNAKVVTVYDADTVTLDVDLGFRVSRRDQFRLYGPDPLGRWGLNAPELYTPAGRAARDYLVDLLTRNGCMPAGLTSTPQQWVQVRTVKDRREKYGRFLAVLFFNHGGEWLNVNQLLLDNGHAVLQVY